MNSIFERRSTRYFTDRPISDEDVRTILKAGMSGPTAVNARDWAFIVVTDREMLDRMADINGKAADPLKRATLGILVCGDLDRSFSKAPNYWIIDGAIAGQNMLLAAQELGIGSVWLGTWPQEDRMKAQAELFNLPENIIPHSILAFGYPLDVVDEKRHEKPEWEADRVHYERW